MTQFRELFRLNVTHEYYGGKFRDVEFLYPAETVQLMKQGKMQAKVIDGTLYVLYETDEAGAPLSSMTGAPFRFGIRSTNPYFSNFTRDTLAVDFTSRISVYYMGGIDQLFFSESHRLVDPVFTHTLTETARPAYLEVLDPSSRIISSEAVTEVSTTEVRFDTAGNSSGLYTVRETYPTLVHTKYVRYQVDSILRRQGAIILLDLPLEEDLYADPNEFEIELMARQETLRYYIVTKGLDEPSFNALTVSDEDTSGDRPLVSFTRVESGDFTGDELPLDLLRSGDERVVLFISEPDVPRRAAGRKNIKLSRGSDVLLANLPQPGPEKADAHMIIHLSKP
jgi:hypothetical protein